MADRDQKLERPKRRPAKGAPSEPLAVVGVGVCAASLRSLEAMFSELGPQVGAAYVVAVRQQEGLTVDAVLEALASQSPLELVVMTIRP